MGANGVPTRTGWSDNLQWNAESIFHNKKLMNWFYILFSSFFVSCPLTAFKSLGAHDSAADGDKQF